MSISVELLENFIVKAQPDLETIKRELSAFNIFNVLGIQHREIRHSNFLGWLFDPNESHQLDDVFLKDLFKLMRKVDVLNAEQLILLLLNDLSDTEVYRESEHNIDILIINEKLGISICIENKINADFSDHQLEKYYDYVEEAYSSITNRIYLTLTPKENHSHKTYQKGEHYYNINYSQIIDILEKNNDSIHNAMPAVKESIYQYIAMVKNNIIYMSEQVTLANEIYRKYKDEINFIINSRPDFKGRKDELWNYIEDGNLQGFSLSHTLETSAIVRILPDSELLKELFRKPEFGSWGEEYIFCIEIFVERNKVWMKWCFGNIDKKHQKSDQFQKIKSDWFYAMRNFDCFKNNNVSINMGGSSPNSNYPAVCTIHLFDVDEYVDEEIEFMKLFDKKFALINTEVIQSWVAECLEKLK